MRWLVLLALLLLPGCWLGPDFYADGDLRQPLPPGDYRMTARPGERDPGIVRATVLADGMTHLVGIDEDGRENGAERMTVGFAALDAEAGLFVGWYVESEDPPVDGDTHAYWLLRRDAGGFTVLMPSCVGEAARAVHEAGGRTANPEGGSVCQFSSRESLETALRAVLPHLRPEFTLTPLAPS